MCCVLPAQRLPYVAATLREAARVGPMLTLCCPRGPSCWRKSAPYAGLCGNNDQIQVFPLCEPMVPHFGLIYVHPLILYWPASKIPKRRCPVLGKPSTPEMPHFDPSFALCWPM